MKDSSTFAILGDLHLGRRKIIINWWDRFLPRSPQEVTGKKTEERLKHFVETINNSPKIDFVVSVGDLTDSMTAEQVRNLKRIMQNLKVPWLPVMGNHDLWSYDRDVSGRVMWHTTKPLAFSEFKEIFRKEFDTALKFFQDWQEQGGNFCNFSFVYKDIKFILADNSDRTRAPLWFPGNNGRGKLYSESEQWLREQLKTSTSKKIVVISHLPLQIRIKSVEKKVLTIAGHRHKFRIVKNNNISSLISNALYIDPIIPIITPTTESFTVIPKSI